MIRLSTGGSILNNTRDFHMTDVTYRIDKELKTPWIGKPYIEYQLVKECDYFDYDNLSCWGEWVRAGEIIFKSKDAALVGKFLKELGEK